MRRKNLVGQRYGKLVVQEMIYGEVRNGKKRSQCLCVCDCGNTTTVVSDRLTSGKKVSCGCDTTERRVTALRVDLTGSQYGRLTAIEMLWGHPTKVRCRCNCGNEVIVTNADLTNGHTQSCGCLQSERSSVYNTKDWTDVVSPYGVRFLRSSHRNKTGQWLWECQCGECDNVFIALPARIMNGHITSCGCRKRSSKEEYIRSILRQADVDFIEQYRFPDCKDKYTLPFDFAIMLDGAPRLLIEYDGKQHYTPVPHFGGTHGHTDTARRDSIKNAYCAKNNISLLRLPYTLSDREIRDKILNTIYP